MATAHSSISVQLNLQMTFSSFLCFTPNFLLLHTVVRDSSLQKTPFHHCTFSFITAHFVHHSTLMSCNMPKTNFCRGQRPILSYISPRQIGNQQSQHVKTSLGES